jgi:hypothetical protein
MYEVFVGTYNEEEQALCWYYYLENKIIFPFQARWGNEIVEVTDMDEDSEEAGSDVRLNVLYREGDMKDPRSDSRSTLLERKVGRIGKGNSLPTPLAAVKQMYSVGFEYL